MGGNGSGRPRAEAPRRLVSTCLVLDCTVLARAGVFAWSKTPRRITMKPRTSSVLGDIAAELRGFEEPDPSLTLCYQHRGADRVRDVRLVVPLATTWQLHGWRRWFLCPACRTRCRRLFLPPGEYLFGCRDCHRLRYASQAKPATADGSGRTIVSSADSDHAGETCSLTEVFADCRPECETGHILTTGAVP